MTLATDHISKQFVEAPDSWVGCGECDCSFPCHNGELRCIRITLSDVRGLNDFTSNYSIGCAVTDDKLHEKLTQCSSSDAPNTNSDVNESQPETFSIDQWWYQELDMVAQTADQRRALAVVRNLLRLFDAASNQQSNINGRIAAIAADRNYWRDKCLEAEAALQQHQSLDTKQPTGEQK